ncbi:hypothetical protein FDE76_13420 [Clostridium botulinum]|uniref:Conserved domain protein n=1 Tax=Clostridium botulinum (strain Eklund 17B / Type B) TaxID=935198 RepID=B2TP13_CLOBB|nr:conserved domain protein [Clostridium botulinum B str. Eklund 17B (NRP)]MBY6976281.1 hypothetical protein [Clostridium botulinum]MBY7000706.1 hypothetical protein [Clostridium botulinum]MCR1273471.1 hypothetical protein [Clostridium botulinum]NFD71275.1 hypothetical protein [Clostridium botulinum]
MSYALYKGEEILGVGTIYELASMLNVQIRTIQYYGTNAYKKKLAKRKSRNVRILIPIDEE